MCTGEWSWVSSWSALGIAGERGGRDSPAGQFAAPFLFGLTRGNGGGLWKVHCRRELYSM